MAPAPRSAIAGAGSATLVRAIGLLNTRRDHPWALPALADAVRTSPSSLVEGL